MKLNIIKWLGMAASLTLVASALAQAPETEKRAYMGVATNPISAGMAEALGVESGIGLVVSQVDPDAPAGAKLEINDVIEQMDDQLLVSREQFSVLVRRAEPGSEVILKVRRDGEVHDVAVELIEKEMPKRRRQAKQTPKAPGFQLPEGFKNFQFPGGITFEMPDPAELENQLGAAMEQLEDALNAQDIDVDGILNQIRPLMEGNGKGDWDVDDIQKHFQKMFPGGNGDIQLQQNATSSSTFVDGDLKITVTETNGHKVLEAFQGEKKVFDGPINNGQDRTKVPADILERLEEMEKFQNNAPVAPRAQGAEEDEDSI